MRIVKKKKIALAVALDRKRGLRERSAFSVKAVLHKRGYQRSAVFRVAEEYDDSFSRDDPELSRLVAKTTKIRITSVETLNQQRRLKIAKAASVLGRGLTLAQKKLRSHVDFWPVPKGEPKPKPPKPPRDKR